MQHKNSLHLGPDAVDLCYQAQIINSKKTDKNARNQFRMCKKLNKTTKPRRQCFSCQETQMGGGGWTNQIVLKIIERFFYIIPYLQFGSFVIVNCCPGIVCVSLKQLQSESVGAYALKLVRVPRVNIKTGDSGTWISTRPMSVVSIP